MNFINRLQTPETVSCIPSTLRIDSLKTQEVRTPVLGPIPAQPDCHLAWRLCHLLASIAALAIRVSRSPPCSAARMPGSVWLSGPEVNFPEILQAGGPLELGKSACFSLLPREAGAVGLHHGPNRNQTLLVSLRAPESEFLPREPPSASLGAQESDRRERDAGTLTYFPTISPMPAFAHVTGWWLQGKCPLNATSHL